MGSDVRRAEQVVGQLRERVAAEGLAVAFELPLYEHPCGVEVEFPNGDGFQLEVSARIERIRVMDPDDFALTVAELGDYVAARTRGRSSKDAREALFPRHSRLR
ncbi:hypothetical protein [Actinomadura decatromicini]|uniref:Uncharacterized protein n=1 Tax=Actinomadura decatromicini TaxID=2604572 RepID=A0A5D3FGU1_9ACTN|nr:hypothetical protein [Actinomadura decatromicini]TYK47192.1 hypothetical protein FXF68_25685 [Actinomadura decatromicini]